MKIAELRIGNFVQINGSSFCKIITIRERYVRLEYLRDDTNSLHRPLIEIERIKPILLSDNWLIKFGFLKNKSDIRYRHLNSLKIKFNHKNEVIYNYSESRIKLSSVHQLQNLYFALTGLELKIKKKY